MSSSASDLALAKGILRGAFTRPDGDLKSTTKEEQDAFHSDLEKAVKSRSLSTSPEV